jgi:hypothetical protein
MKTIRLFTLSLLLLTHLSSFVKAQTVPQVLNKPQPEMDMEWDCPPLGRLSKYTDPETNRLKNRIDSPPVENRPVFHKVGLKELKSLPSPIGFLKKKRSDWTPQQREIVEKNEGIPIAVLGYLLVTSVNGKAVGAIAEGPESCNCGRRELKHVDFRLWLVENPNDSKADAVIVQMTPRVRARRSKQWTLENLTYIAKERFPVIVYGWLMFEEGEQKGVGKSRATLWEIHPLIQIEFIRNGEWITL